MNIRESFLKLTQFTYPYGHEAKLKHLLPVGTEKDKFGNYFYRIGNSETMFTCHLDTCSARYEKITHVVGQQFIKTNGKTILGADDKAGMTILLYMIENKIPGLYYFFIGEEVGGIGSKDAAKLNFSSYKRCVSFDRRGYSSVITEQFYGRCCSDGFARELSNRLNDQDLTFKFSPDPTGIFTDSASFMSHIPECTNISVGYFGEHTTKEKQDIQFLSKLCGAVIKIDWETLPVFRSTTDNEIFYVNRRVKNLFKGRYTDFADMRLKEQDLESSHGINKSHIQHGIDHGTIEPKKESKEDNLSATIVVWVGDKKWKARLTNKRIIEERSYIYRWALVQGYYPDIKAVLWDGKSCSIECKYTTDYLGERDEMIHVISELENIPLESLNLIKRV